MSVTEDDLPRILTEGGVVVEQAACRQLKCMSKSNTHQIYQEEYSGEMLGC